MVTANGNAVPSSFTNSINWSVMTTTSGANATPASVTGSWITFRPDIAHASYTPGGGNLNKSTSISYKIDAAVGSVSHSRTINQDETNVIRQEYVNHGIAILSRSNIAAPIATANFTVDEINITDYSLIVGTTGTLAQQVRDRFNIEIRNALSLPSTPSHGLILSSG